MSLTINEFLLKIIAHQQQTKSNEKAETWEIIENWFVKKSNEKQHGSMLHSYQAKINLGHRSGPQPAGYVFWYMCAI